MTVDHISPTSHTDHATPPRASAEPNPTPRSTYATWHWDTTGRRNTVATNLLNRLDTQREDVLRFAADWRVPFDNYPDVAVIPMSA